MARKRPTPAPQQQQMSFEEALARAYAHWEAGQADQAEMICQRVLAAWPGQADALHLLGIMAHAFGNLDLALQHVRQSCLAPRAPAQFFSNLAEMCRQKGLLEEGERAGRRAVALDANMVAAWNNLGIILQEAGNLAESAACLERVVFMQPDNAEAHNNLGNTFKMLGQLDKSAAHYSQALKIFPNYAEAHSNLAHLLVDTGELDRAATEARLAIDINPRLLDAYINLAGVELARQRPAEALRWLDAALAFAPGHPKIQVARAKALRTCNLLPQALDAAQRAVMAAPQSADAHNALGESLRALDRPQEAMAAYDQAAKLPGAAGGIAQINQSTLLSEQGHIGDAKALLGKILEAHPRCVPAWYNLAELKTFAPGDPDIPRMAALLEPAGAQVVAERIAMNFALGKAHLDTGDSEVAFRHLHEGNRMKRATLSYDGAVAAQHMQALKKAFPAALFKKLKGLGNASEAPVFVIGMPRSGTSLVEQILASHPQVHGAGELRAVQALVDSVMGYPESLQGIGAEDLAKLGDAYLAHVTALGQGKRRVVDKMPANFLHAGLIHLVLPNARIIHCRRDPVDTCMSCYSKLFGADHPYSYDLAELGAYHRQYQALTAHWRKVLPKSRFMDVDYEAVVGDLEGQARRLLEFIGLPWHEACLRPQDTVRPVRTASATQVRKPVYATSVGRWQPHAQALAPLLAALEMEAP